MTDYEILTDYGRMLDERDILEAKLNELTVRHIFSRSRRNDPEFYIKTVDKTGNSHAKRIDARQYADYYEMNYEVKYFTRRLNELNAQIIKYQVRIPALEKHIISLYLQQKKLTQIKTSGSEMKNTYLFRQENLIFRTERGEFVRSKTEGTIADKLHRYGIFYEYEWNLPGTKLHPDFYIKNNIRQTPVIWEHFGMMDDTEYVQDYLRKLETYRKHGFVPGKNLITTFEFYGGAGPGSRIVFDARDAELTIKEWFLPEGIISLSPDRLKNVV